MKNFYLRYLKQKEKRDFRLFILFGNVRNFKIFSYSTGPDKIKKNKRFTSKQNNLENFNNSSKLTKTSRKKKLLDNSTLIIDESILKSNEQTKSHRRTLKRIKSPFKDKIEPSLNRIKENVENDLNEQFQTAILKEKRLITISLAPPQLIRQWAETKLPNGKVVGQVMNANTLHYNTFLPMKGGLFCERIFGPIKDFQCACGIQKGKPLSVNNSFKKSFLKDQEPSLLSKNMLLDDIKLDVVPKRLFCPKCDVEYTWSDKRRVQQGYIQLASPVTHIWYLKSSPSTISILLGMTKTDAEAVTYCIDTLTLDLALQTGRYIDSSDQLQNFLKLNRNNMNFKPKNRHIQVNKNKIYSKPKHIDWWRKRDKSKSFFKEQLINFKNHSKILIKKNFFEISFFKFPIYNLMKSVCLGISRNIEKYFFKTSFYKRKIMYLVKSKKHSPYNLLLLLKGSKSGNLFLFNRISHSNKKEFAIYNRNNKKLTLNRFLDDIKPLSPASSMMSFIKMNSFEITNRISSGGPILLNNIYSLSHRYKWNSDVKVQKFLSYIWPSNDLRAIPISNYKHRIVNSIFSQQYAIAGGGILAQLLSECNFHESHRIIYQLEARIPNLIHKLRNVPTKKEKKELRELLKIALLRIQFYKTAFQPKSLDTLDSLLKLKDKSSYDIKSNIVFNIKESKKNKYSFKKISQKPYKSFLNPKPNKAYTRSLNKRLYSNSSFLLNNKNKSILNSGTRINNKNLKVTSFSIEWMFISVLPVLPPALRPILKMQDQIISTDLNRLYQKIIYRNERVKKFMKDSATRNSSPMLFAQKLLQESVDNLIENGKSGTKPETDKKGRPLKSLGELLKGKQGRFRQNLLGKRVDYSGRSVIVVGPRLKLSECGLPKEMALELFRPFLIKEIVINGAAKTVIGAKNLIKTDPVQTTFFLKRVLEQNLVLLNRAPTLHRVGFQAFRPKLIEGRAILLHPLVCPAFNADFDGDQMAVHVPLTYEARAEALKFLLSPHNIMSPATGEPLAQPSQDMVLGCYYLTTFLNKKKNNFPINSKKCNNKFYFGNFDEVLFAYQKNIVSLHTKIWVKYDGLIQMDKNDKYMKKEIRIYPTGQNIHINSKLAIVLDSNLQKINQIVLTTPGRILFNFLIYKKFN